MARGATPPFVDEAIHHMTPQRGHRKVYGQDLEQFLNTHHKQRFEAAKRADNTTDAAMWNCSKPALRRARSTS